MDFSVHSNANWQQQCTVDGKRSKQVSPTSQRERWMGQLNTWVDLPTKNGKKEPNVGK